MTREKTDKSIGRMKRILSKGYDHQARTNILSERRGEKKGERT